jgi:hypothetical protein
MLPVVRARKATSADVILTGGYRTFVLRHGG